MTPVEKLQAARDYLIENGWHQGGVGPRDPLTAERTGEERCIIGAHWEVCDRQSLSSKPALRYIARIEPGIIAFNDDPSTTFNDVMNLFDEAILLAKEAEAR